jgi:hypothetical protein
MSSISSLKTWLTLTLLLAAASAEAAPVVNAASCEQAAVQTALNAIAADGTTVQVPAGNCTWTGPVDLSTKFSFVLQGKSTVTASDAHGNPSAFMDATTITDGQSVMQGPAILSISLTGSASQVVRMTGISFHGGPLEYNGDIVFDGNTGQIRIDHNHFINESDLALSTYEPMTGVVDHNLFDVPGGNVWNGVRIYNTGGAGYGDTPWTQAPGYGTANFIFLENNTFNNGFMNDCEDGGTFVARYNTFNVTVANQNIGIQGHATGSQPRGRGCRTAEVYGNWVGGGGGTIQYSVGFLTSGSAMWWGNTIANADFDLALVEDREGDNYGETAAPNGWGYCGNAQTGSLSGFDGNTSSSGYPCIDQVGRGKGDSISGYWPNVQDDTQPGVYTGVWPHQAVEPVYVWSESFTGSHLVNTSSKQDNIQANRDYYATVANFNGTSGTGAGTFASRPTTCTAGPGGDTPGVGYWATDKDTLYVCTATNTWTAYYMPYTYPHPLVSGTVSAPPAAPTGLTAVVH